MNPILLLLNQLINPFLRDFIPFFQYRRLHFHLIGWLLLASVKSLFYSPLAFLNRVHIRTDCWMGE
jgi:hypothetical protein